MEPDSDYCDHISPPLDPSRARWILCRSYEPNSSGRILALSSNPSLGLESGLYLSSYPTEILQDILISPIHATSAANFITFELNILIIFGKQYVCSTRHTVLKHCLPIIFTWSEKYVSHYYIIIDKLAVLYRPIPTFTFCPYTWTITITGEIVLIIILDTENSILVLTR